MQIRMKRPHNEIKDKGVVLWLTLPEKNLAGFLRAAEKFGVSRISDTVPWRDAFSEYPDEEMPGTILCGARTKGGLTQKQLAEKLRLNQGYVSDMERGRRAISRSMAKKLGEILKINYRVLL